MVVTKKAYTPLEVPNGHSTKHRNSQTNNMSFANKAAMGREQNGNGFRTDSAISGNRFQGERVLQPWVPDASVPDTSLESNSKSGKTWDQFAANEQLFGLKTDYDENIYTTQINTNHPDYKRRVADADRKAREIENSLTTNRHVQEERIQDNLAVDNSGLDEEDKYSGVQKQDFPPLSSSNRGDKYTPPGRRGPAPKPTVNGPAHVVDPAIRSSQIAGQPRQTAPGVKSEQPKQAPKAAAPSKPDLSTPPPTTESSFSVTPEPKATPSGTSTAASRTESPKVQVPAAPAAPAAEAVKGVSATATVERDVVTAFKGFAAQQRTQAEKVRLGKAKADKEAKLMELKAFASSFKLHSAIPSDLVAIIAKDPAKQRAIQENARRQAEEVQQEKALKANASQSTTPSTPATPADSKTSQRTAAAQAPAIPTGGPRHTPGRAPNGPQGPYNNNNTQNFRQQERGMRNQGSPHNFAGPQQPMAQRPRNGDQNRNGGYPVAPYDNRQPPTGPADAASRRTSAASSQKLNPGSLDFRPNAFAPTFVPTGSAKPSAASTPRSESVEGPLVCQSKSGLLIKRKPGQPSTKKPAKKVDIMERLSSETPPPNKDWSRNGGIKPAFDTLPVWRQVKDDEPEDSTMHMTYAKVFEKARFPPQPMSPPQNVSNYPQVPHQHQLPLHLQQGAHIQRPSPRQPQLHMHNNMGQPFQGHDDHRMMPSLSAQSFASPRLQQVPMAYPAPSPMGQPAQLFQQPIMYMGPGGAPQMAQFNRSYSGGGQQFVPQQPTHMAGPVMMGGPQAPYFGAPNLMAPGPQMMYPNGQPMPFPQQGGPPVPMPGVNGYPSPGRGVGAPMMMPSGSQQGQQGFTMSPGMQYGQPIYAQHVPQQMQQQMRGFPQQGPQFGASPMPHYNQPHHNGGGRPNGNHYNNRNQNNHNQHQNQNGNGGPPHPPAQPNNVNVPTGPQRPSPEADEAK